MNAFPALETPRLLLREIQPSDSASIFDIHSDPTVMRLFGSDPLPDIDAASALIEIFASWRTLPNPGTRWGIQLKDDSALIGTCGLFGWNRSWKKCTVGYELAPEWQKKGLMGEALTCVLQWGFCQMSLHRIEAQIHPQNQSSIKLAGLLGFKVEGVLREAGHWGGNVHDMLQFGLLHHELRPSHKVGADV